MRKQNLDPAYEIFHKQGLGRLVNTSLPDRPSEAEVRELCESLLGPSPKGVFALSTVLNPGRFVYVQSVAHTVLDALIRWERANLPHIIAQLQYLLPHRTVVDRKLTILHDAQSHEDFMAVVILRFAATGDPKRLGRCLYCRHYFYNRTRHRAKFCPGTTHRFDYHNSKRRNRTPHN